MTRSEQGEGVCLPACDSSSVLRTVFVWLLDGHGRRLDVGGLTRVTCHKLSFTESHGVFLKDRGNHTSLSTGFGFSWNSAESIHLQETAADILRRGAG